MREHLGSHDGGATIWPAEDNEGVCGTKGMLCRDAAREDHGAGKRVLQPSKLLTHQLVRATLLHK